MSNSQWHADQSVGERAATGDNFQEDAAAPRLLHLAKEKTASSTSSSASSGWRSRTLP